MSTLHPEKGRTMEVERREKSSQFKLPEYPSSLLSNSSGQIKNKYDEHNGSNKNN